MRNGCELNLNFYDWYKTTIVTEIFDNADELMFQKLTVAVLTLDDVRNAVNASDPFPGPPLLIWIIPFGVYPERSILKETEAAAFAETDAIVSVYDAVTHLVFYLIGYPCFRITNPRIICGASKIIEAYRTVGTYCALQRASRHSGKAADKQWKCQCHRGSVP